MYDKPIRFGLSFPSGSIPSINLATVGNAVGEFGGKVVNTLNLPSIGSLPLPTPPASVYSDYYKSFRQRRENNEKNNGAETPQPDPQDTVTLQKSEAENGQEETNTPSQEILYPTIFPDSATLSDSSSAINSDLQTAQQYNSFVREFQESRNIPPFNRF